MNQETIDQILAEVKVKLNEIFKDTMVFGFVCGGFSKGYADETHDVDIFVCTIGEISEEMEKTYLTWYFDLHKRFGITPDYDYPGEIVTFEKLTTTLKRLETLQLTLKIDDVLTKKAIIWADMITSKTAAETGAGVQELYALKDTYARYPEKWKKEVLALIPESEVDAWKDKSHLLIMEHYMQYPKHDGKKLDRFYS